jgi:hypothetical protein
MSKVMKLLFLAKKVFQFTAHLLAALLQILHLTLYVAAYIMEGNRVAIINIIKLFARFGGRYGYPGDNISYKPNAYGEKQNHHYQPDDNRVDTKIMGDTAANAAYNFIVRITEHTVVIGIIGISLVSLT